MSALLFHRVRAGVALVLGCVVASAVAGCGGKDSSPKTVDLGLPTETTGAVTATSTSPSPTTSTSSAPAEAGKATPKGWKPAADAEEQAIFDAVQRYNDVMMFTASEGPAYRAALRKVATSSVAEEVWGNMDRKYFSKGQKFEGSIAVFPRVTKREPRLAIVHYCADSRSMRQLDATGKQLDVGALETGVGEAIVEKLDGKWLVAGTKPVKGESCDW